MPSPFPGMDPYIESTADWHSFHNGFIAATAGRLNKRLPRGYVASPVSQVRLVATEGPGRQHREPDIAITRRPTRAGPSRGSDPAVAEDGGGVATIGRVPPVSAVSAIATIAPRVMRLPGRLVETDEWAVHVLRLPDRDLVTAMELLSPTNKDRRGRRDYARKRLQLIRRGVHLVEVDLLLEGRRPPMGDPLPTDGYYAMVGPVESYPRSDVYAWSVRDPLPTIPVPLRPGDDDVPLDLADVFAFTYDDGRYEELTRYDFPPPPGLPDADRAWAAGLAATAVRR